jgi:hypothetical protein
VEQARERTTGVSVQYAPPSMIDLDVLGDERALAVTPVCGGRSPDAASWWR